MKIRQLFVLIAAGLISSSIAADSKINILQEYLKKFAFTKADHKVKEGFPAGTNRAVYSIQGKVKLKTKAGKTYVCSYSHGSDLPVDGPSDKTSCMLSNQGISSDGGRLTGFNVVNQIVKVEKRKSGEKDPYCYKHMLNTAFEASVDDINKPATKFGQSETTIYSTCQD